MVLVLKFLRWFLGFNGWCRCLCVRPQLCVALEVGLLFSVKDAVVG